MATICLPDNMLSIFVLGAGSYATVVCGNTSKDPKSRALVQRVADKLKYSDMKLCYLAEDSVLAVATPGTPLSLRFSDSSGDNSSKQTPSMEEWRMTFVDRECPKYCLSHTKLLLQERLHLIEQFVKELELELVDCKLRLEQQTEEKKGLELELVCCKSQLEQQAQEKKKIQLELEQQAQEKKNIQLELEQQTQEKKKIQLELECSKLQLERQAHQMQAQEDRLSKIELIMKDTDKILASLPSRPAENRLIEYDRPKERGTCYWIFHKYHSGIKNAFMTSLVELTHQLASERVISPTMEKYIENETIPYEQKADELIKAVQYALDGNPENFRKVINVLKMSRNSVCKKLSDRLACDYQLSNAHMN